MAIQGIFGWFYRTLTKRRTRLAMHVNACPHTIQRGMLYLQRTFGEYRSLTNRLKAMVWLSLPGEVEVEVEDG